MYDLKKYLYLYKRQKRIEGSLFYRGFSAMNHWFEETAVDTGDKFSITYFL